jgi:LytS/YehU family sensor histidine kinase
VAAQLSAAVSCSVGELAAEPSPGVGLLNVRRRLELVYGDAASLELAALAGGGVRAVVRWPCTNGPCAS